MALVLLLLHFLLCGVGVVEVGCLVRCLLWRLVGPVWCACGSFLGLVGCGNKRVRSIFDERFSSDFFKKRSSYIAMVGCFGLCYRV